jgi:hypothetical protein
VTALDYGREQNLTEEGRVLRQQSLIRAVIRKLVHRHLLSNPVTDYHLDARISAQLWAAIRQDTITAFAEKYPFTVTPAAPR